MSNYFCYTTVYQAIELFSFIRTEKEAKAIEDSMAAMKLMGLNPKNARRYGKMISENTNVKSWNILIAGLCLESRLPLLTDREKDFVGIKGLVIIPMNAVERGGVGEYVRRPKP